VLVCRGTIDAPIEIEKETFQMQWAGKDPVRHATAHVGQYGSALRAASGTVVLLIHGLAGDHLAWNPRSRRGVEPCGFAPDSRGAGRSTQVDEPITKPMEAMAHDFLALMDSASMWVERPLKHDRSQIWGAKTRTTRIGQQSPIIRRAC
jgi:hypothetical protein